MPAVFLIGGGRDDDAAARASHAPFLQACGDGAIVCVYEDDPERWLANLGGEARMVRLGEPVDLAGAAGLYVAGGLTPAYHEALSGLRVDIPYCGFSAGAAIASKEVILGGWRIGDRQVCDEDFSEGLEQVEVKPGLGLVPFAVDVHATQWGTVTRALNAVERGLVGEALAIDEHCCVEYRDGALALHGRGVAYRVHSGAIELLAA